MHRDMIAKKSGNEIELSGEEIDDSNYEMPDPKEDNNSYIDPT